MRKILSMFLCAVMVLSMTTVAFAADFNDVNKNHAQYEAVETLETLDIVNGFSESVYGPDEVLTRAQLCTMLVRAMYGDDIHYGESAFTDVPLNHWARAAIDTAYKNKLMVGYSSNKFGPEDKLTYTQTARTILNAIGYGNLSWPTGVNAVAHELGLYDNVVTTSFENGCTRAHAAQMIYNAFDLELVKEYAGQHFGTNKYFLADILGYKEVSEYIDGHLYVAYKDLNDKDADLLVTDIRSTFEKTIYPCGENEYKFVDSNRADKFKFDWAKVDLFVNGVDVNDSTWFVNAESVIGVFDDKDNLIAIYVTNNGKDYIPGTIVIGEDTIGLPDKVENKIKKDKNFDEKTSTVTYFEEDNDYVISNKIACGFVDTRSTKSFWIDDVKYTFDDPHGYVKGDFVVIYFNHDDEIAGSKKLNIDEAFIYDVDDFIIHTWECKHYNDNWDEDYWMTFSKIKFSGTQFADKMSNNGVLYFDICEDCHADKVTKEYTDIVPVKVVSAEGWVNYHVIDCPNLNDADKSIATEYNITSGTRTPCTTCIH